MTKTTRIAAGIVAAFAVVGAAPARAQPAGSEGLVGGRSLDEARARIAGEPTVAETLRVALRYFRVDPANFDRLRRTSHLRAWLPTFAAGYRMDDDEFVRAETEQFQPRRFSENTDARVHTVSVGAVWDLRELVFNPAEVQVYGLIGVQRSLMLEVTRVYYLRRQLFVRFVNAPPEDPMARDALFLRIDEFTSLLDVLTDGWFTAETERRLARRAPGRAQGAAAHGGATRASSGALAMQRELSPAP